ncbi:hypothetical protein BGZ96_000868 [Linnemannia gamsii]|uniref:F-box domain-containing protein n=1 Tax=Linnemannia gamsii TaxID=64522 RepID=A0ABQ7KBG3_9FUNG|nr:hypothetical protein BGZ96_000868 [Linnemannia gamsii]
MNPLLLPEIILLIGARLTRSETIACLRVCSLWHATLVPLLYYNFTLPHKQQHKSTRHKKRKQRWTAPRLSTDYGHECGSGALLVGRNNSSSNSKNSKSNYLRRLSIPTVERNAHHIRRLTTSSLQLLEHLSSTCRALQKWTFTSHVDQRALFLIVLNQETLRTVHLVYPKPRPIGPDEVKAMATLFRIMNEQLTGLQELCLQNTRVEMNSVAGSSLVNLCRQKRGFHLDLRRFGVLDWPTMAPPLAELQQQQHREGNHGVNATELDKKDGAVVTTLVPLVLDRLDTLTLYGIDQPRTLQVQLIRQCHNMTRLHWVSKPEYLNSVELGNTPFWRLRVLELGHSVSSEDTFMARMVELMPALEALTAGLRWLGEKAIKAICDKEDRAWTNSVNGSGVKVCHLQEITLAERKGSSRNKATRPIGDMLTHCRFLKKLVLTGIKMADLRTSLPATWTCLDTLEELSLNIYDPRGNWESRINTAVDIYDDEVDGTEFRIVLMQNVTRLKNIRILGLSGVIWMQMIRDVDKYKQQQQHLQQLERTTLTLLDLVRLQEIDVLPDKLSSNLVTYSFGSDVRKYLYNALRRIVPSLRRLLYNGDENGFLVADETTMPFDQGWEPIVYWRDIEKQFPNYQLALFLDRYESKRSILRRSSDGRQIVRDMEKYHSEQLAHHEKSQAMIDNVLLSVKAGIQALFELPNRSIPRMFIVTPEPTSKSNPAKMIYHSYRLFLLCECGDASTIRYNWD